MANLIETDYDALPFTILFEGGTRSGIIRTLIKDNLNCCPKGNGNKARRRVAKTRNQIRIKSRLISLIDGLSNSYYFEKVDALDLPGSAPICCASSDAEYFVGDIVELDTGGHFKGGWGRIIRLIDSSNRTHDARWAFDTPDYLKEKFTLPSEPEKNAEQLTEINIWENTTDAVLTLDFTPSFWQIDASGNHELKPPRLRFDKMVIFDPIKTSPSGYLHHIDTKPFHAISPIFVRDSITKKIDEFFIARIWAGKDRDKIIGGIKLPGIGATIQHIHFNNSPDVILGEKFFYA